MSGRVWSDPRRMGGVPCFYGPRTRVDEIRQMVDFESITLEDVPYYFPSLAGVDLSHAVKANA